MQSKKQANINAICKTIAKLPLHTLEGEMNMNRHYNGQFHCCGSVVTQQTTTTTKTPITNAYTFSKCSKLIEYEIEQLIIFFHCRFAFVFGIAIF